MDRSDISLILHELDINENSIANIYNYGSWVYGTNSSTSDRDLMIVTRSHNQTPLKFDDDFDYFHTFELHKLWNRYDVCIHSVENFKILLQKNYLLAIECIFLPNEFKIKEEIDFQPIYLEKYYDKIRLKTVSLYENLTVVNIFKSKRNPNYARQRSRSSQSYKDYLFKNLFHGLRYLDVAEQLITTRSIYNFKNVSHIFDKMKDIRDDPANNSNMDIVFDFVDKLSNEYKIRLNTLVETNIIKGMFEVNVTFDCSHDTEQVVERLKSTCANTKFKIVLIDSVSQEIEDEAVQLILSSSYSGDHPSIVKQIEQEVNDQFKQFNIIRIKIKSSSANDGVPKTDIEKILLWNEKMYYFESRYKILVKKSRGGNKLYKLRTICQSNRRYHLSTSLNGLQQVDENHFHYMITTRFFDVGRNRAFKENDAIIEYLTKNNFPPLETYSEFIVYDTNKELDKEWK